MKLDWGRRPGVACAWFVATGCSGALGACSRGTASASPANGAAAALLAARPYGLDVPKAYDPSKPAPLLLALHPLGSDGNDMTATNWGVAAAALAHGAFVAHPHGTIDRQGHPRFWDATDACCSFFGGKVDDAAYLTAVIDDVSARYHIDPQRIWVAGTSNGGFMAHRLACDRSRRVAAIVSIAGATWLDAAKCAQSEPVSVLEVHSAGDQVVAYAGGPGVLDGKNPYPSTDATVAQAAAKDGCTGTLTSTGAPSRLMGDDPSQAMDIARYSGCPAGIDVERWRLAGAAHVPRPPSSWDQAVVAWLEKHPKP
jgi:polyhydroxybutyrate depolymerase